jgi:hypothetical protein
MLNGAGCLGEVVAAKRALDHWPKLRNAGDGSARGNAPAACFDKCPQHRQRQHLVTGVCGIVHCRRQIRLLRQRAQPLAVFTNKAPDSPVRQFDLDQGEYGIGPSARLDQMANQGLLAEPARCRQARACGCDDFREKLQRRPGRVPQLFIQPVQKKFMVRSECHDRISRHPRRKCPGHKVVSNAIKKPDDPGGKVMWAA